MKTLGNKAVYNRLEKAVDKWSEENDVNPDIIEWWGGNEDDNFWKITVHGQNLTFSCNRNTGKVSVIGSYTAPPKPVLPTIEVSEEFHFDPDEFTCHLYHRGDFAQKVLCGKWIYPQENNPIPKTLYGEIDDSVKRIHNTVAPDYETFAEFFYDTEEKFLDFAAQSENFNYWIRMNHPWADYHLYIKVYEKGAGK